MRVNNSKCSRNSADCKIRRHMFLSLLYRHTSLGVWTSHVCFRPYFLCVQSRGEMNLVVLKTVFTESMENRPIAEYLNQNLWRVKSWHLYFIKTLLLILWYSQGWWPRGSLKVSLRLSKVLHLQKIRVWPLRPPLPLQAFWSFHGSEISLNTNNWRRDTISPSNSHVVTSICNVDNNDEQFHGKHIISRRLRNDNEG